MRLFLAIDLPPRVRDAVAEVQERTRRSCPGWRWVRPEGIHLTLRFLGEVTPADEARQRETWRRAVAGHPRVRFDVGGLGVFPGGGRPRVLWLGVKDASPAGDLAALAEALEETARELGFEPDERPFRAHLTLARAEREGRPVSPAPGGALLASDLVADEVVLFQSELGPGGARYGRVAALPLGGAA
jgi:2'-5' RNA ligase